MILELIICIIHSPPGVNSYIEVPQNNDYVTYTMDSMLTLLTLPRFYLLWRVFARYSYWNDEKAE